MKLISEPVEMLSYTLMDGTVRPVKFRVKNEEMTYTVIKVDRILQIDKNKMAGNEMLVYRCQSAINGMERLYELRLDMRSCRWVLYKI